MEEKIDIVEIQPFWNRKRIMVLVICLFVVLLGVFGYRAYSLATSVIVQKSGSASPLLSDDARALKNLEKLAPGDRRINILFLGSGGKNHPGGELTDTIMVASIDIKNNSVSMISLPRDLYIPVKGYGKAKINTVFTLGKENGDADEDGYRLIKETVSTVLGVPIHYFVHVDFEGFEKMIDILGGVSIDVKEDLYDPTFPDEAMLGYDEFYVQKGWRHFDGESALKYARSRHSTSDFDRARRQQEILAATKDELLKKENVFNVKKISQIMTALADHLKTDLQIPELESLARIATKIDSQKISTRVVDDSAQGIAYADNYDGMYVLVLYDNTFADMHRYVEMYFQDPFLASEQAKISVLNGSAKTGLAQSIGDDLSKAGFNIIEIASTPDKKKYEKSIIYDYTNGEKKSTIGFLSKYLGGDIEVIALDRTDDEQVDIEVIIGEDYASDAH